VKSEELVRVKEEGGEFVGVVGRVGLFWSW
jgi:hypothetical protein